VLEAKLRDEGKLSLDDAAAKWIPELAGMRPRPASAERGRPVGTPTLAARMWPRLSALPANPRRVRVLDAALILLAERRQFGPSTQAIVDEAVSRDIPWIRLNEQSLVQLGQGKYQQRIRATMTSKTSALAVDIASDKKMTNRLLAAAGLPVPRSEVVRSEDEAVAAAKRIGFPVVTKPLDGNHGRGVGLELRAERSVRVAFRRALAAQRAQDAAIAQHDAARIEIAMRAEPQAHVAVAVRRAVVGTESAGPAQRGRGRADKLRAHVS